MTGKIQTGRVVALLSRMQPCQTSKSSTFESSCANVWYFIPEVVPSHQTLIVPMDVPYTIRLGCWVIENTSRSFEAARPVTWNRKEQRTCWTEPTPGNQAADQWLCCNTRPEEAKLGPTRIMAKDHRNSLSPSIRFNMTCLIRRFLRKVSLL